MTTTPEGDDLTPEEQVLADAENIAAGAEEEVVLEGLVAAETLAYSIDKLIKENEDKLPEDVKTEVQTAVTELKTALAGTDLDEVKAKHSALLAVSQKIGEAIYSADNMAANAPADEQPAADATADEDVVDAEIVDDEDEARK